MEDEIKTVDASEDVVSETPVEEVKPKRKYTRRKKEDEAPAEEIKEEPKAEEPTEEPKEAPAEVVEEPKAEELAPVEEVQAEEPKEEVTAEPEQEEVAEPEPVVEEPINEQPVEEVKEEPKKEEPKQPAKKETIEVSKNVKAEVTIDWDKAVNKFFIATRQISISRAPSTIALGKPFKGRLQIVENTNDLFVKVRYVRSGLGATYGYAKKSQIIQTGCKIS